MHPFDDAAIVLAAAALLVVLLHRFRQSSIVAHLLLGMAVGPHALDLVPSGALVDRLAEIGVILLLFFIGLEFQVGELKRMSALALGGTALQIALTTTIATAAARFLGFALAPACLFGFCVALSSTAIVMKAFEDRRETDGATAKTSLAILLGQDLAAMGALGLSALVKVGEGTEGPRGNPLALFGLPLLFFAARTALPRLFARAAVTRNPEVFALASLASCFLVAAAAQWLGASLVLGAFLGGMVFAGTAVAHQIRADLATVRTVALALFFLSIGALVDPRYLRDHAGPLAGALVVVVVAKSAIATLVLRTFRLPWSVASGAGLALAQVGEFAFVLASSGLGQVLGEEPRRLLVPLAVLSMLPTPFFVGASGRFGAWVAGLRGARAGVGSEGGAGWLTRRPVAAAASEPASPTYAAGPVPLSETLAIVVGYGPVGRTLCRILLRLGLRVCVIDLSPATVEKLKRLGREAVFGDAGRREVLRAAGLERARWLLITLPNLEARAAIIATARAVAPWVNILSRARYLEERTHLEAAGADQIAYEEAEVAMELARLLLAHLGVAPEVLEEEVASIRSEIAVRTGFSTISLREGDPPNKDAVPP
jgi:CPA2 family monovalent cation:H+ antiporter-2